MKKLREFWLSRTWGERRRVKTLLIMLVAGLIGAAIALAVAQADQLGGLSAQEARAALRSRLGMFGFFLDVPILRGLLAEHPRWTIGAFGFFLIGGVVSATRRRALHDIFFAGFNDGVLRPIRSLRRHDLDSRGEFVFLSWTPGKTGARAEAWAALEAWAHAGTEPRQSLLSFKPAVPLSMVVLTGRGGSGKSRMSHELGRHLARRAWLGEEEAGDLQDDPERPASILGWRLASWFRRVAWGLKPKPHDPWDAGLIRPPEGSSDWEGLVAGLEGWRPRRPTLLILDDPPADKTALVWRALVKGKEAYRHPVRLLVANQTIPPGTDYVWDETAKAWMFNDQPADPPPVRLPKEAWFTREELSEILARGGWFTGPDRGNIGKAKAAREDLFPISQGQPLMVQLALEHIIAHGSLDGVDQHELVARRAGRILSALKARGVIGHGQLLMLAVATLTRGAPQDRLKTCTRQTEDLPLKSTLQACFPAEPLETEGGDLIVPPVRPEIVGDAFVEAVLGEIQGNKADDIVQAAFRLAPGEMLRGLRRPRRTDSALGAALARVDPDQIEGLDPVDLALALADVAAVCQPDDRPLSTDESRAAACDAAISAIGRLDSDQSDRFCVGFVDSLTKVALNPLERQVRGPEALALFGSAARKASGHGEMAGWEAMFSLQRLAGVSEWSADGLSALLSEEPSPARADQLWCLAWPRFAQVSVTPLGPIAEMLAARFRDEPRGRLYAAAQAAVRRDGPAASEAVRTLIASVPADDKAAAQLLALQGRYYEAFAWINGSDPGREQPAMQAARAASDIADASPDDLEAQRWAAWSWVELARHWMLFENGAKAAECAIAAEEVERLAQRFPFDEQLIHAAVDAFSRATHSAAHAPMPLDMAPAEALAHRGAAWAAHRPEVAAIQDAAAFIQKTRAFGWSRLGESGLDKIREAIAEAEALAARFPAEPDIAASTIHARSTLVNAFLSMPGGVEAEQAAEVIRGNAEIAARYPDFKAVQYETAQGMHLTGAVWVRRADGALADRIADLAEQAATVAVRFWTEARYKRMAVLARSQETQAWANRPLGAEADRASRSANQAAAYAPYLDMTIRDNRSDQAKVRNFEGLAWSRRPLGAGAAEAERAADAAAVAGVGFEGDDGLQQTIVNALFHALHAWAHRPGGSGIEEAQRVASRIIGIVDRFPDHIEFERNRAGVGRILSYGWSQRPEGAEAERADEELAVVREVARRHPGDRQIQYAVAEAAAHTADAWSRKPGRDRQKRAQAAADVASAASALWPQDSEIAAVAAQAQGFASAMKAS